MNGILNSLIRTVFVSPTGPKTESVPNKAFLLEWLFCSQIFQLEICGPSEKPEPLVTEHTAKGQCKDWGHVSVPRQVQETGTGVPSLWEPDNNPFSMRSPLWGGLRKQRRLEEPGSNPGYSLDKPRDLR